MAPALFSSAIAINPKTNHGMTPSARFPMPSVGAWLASVPDISPSASTEPEVAYRRTTATASGTSRRVRVSFHPSSPDMRQSGDDLVPSTSAASVHSQLDPGDQEASHGRGQWPMHLKAVQKYLGGPSASRIRDELHRIQRFVTPPAPPQAPSTNGATYHDIMNLVLYTA